MKKINILIISSLIQRLLINTMIRGLYRHITTGRLYFAEGLAMNAKNPAETMVVYCQKYEGEIIGLNLSRTNLPTGTMWMRPQDEFLSKFQKVEEKSVFIKSMTSVVTALEKDLLFYKEK